MTTRILTGDVREILPLLEAGSVQCCVTSPPYFGLRDYGAAAQIGLEPSPDEYVAEMVSVFRAVRRVLRDDGTLWLNLGDSYAGSRCGPQGNSGAFADRSLAGQRVIRAIGGNHVARGGAKPKDLLGIPWMAAFALRADGWFLRSAVVWEKPNPMPESCTDRPTSSYEMVFLLSKSGQYFYDGWAIRESAVGMNPHDLTGGDYAAPGQSPHTGSRRAKGNAKTFRGGGAYTKGRSFDNSATVGRESAGNVPNVDGTRNARNVWSIATQPFAGSHFATMPPDLAERCIKAGTSEGGACASCGAPLERIIGRGAPDLEHKRACGGDAAGEYTGQSTKGHAAAGVQDASAVKARILAGMVEKFHAGWLMTCKCPMAKPVPCLVLDPFGGAGTTGMVADRLKRNAVLIELNPKYAAMAAARIKADGGLFAEIAA